MRLNNSFRPRLESLEGRDVPSAVAVAPRTIQAPVGHFAPAPPVSAAIMASPLQSAQVQVQVAAQQAAAAAPLAAKAAVTAQPMAASVRAAASSTAGSLAKTIAQKLQDAYRAWNEIRTNVQNYINNAIQSVTSRFKSPWTNHAAVKYIAQIVRNAANYMRNETARYLKDPDLKSALAQPINSVIQYYYSLADQLDGYARRLQPK